MNQTTKPEPVLSPILSKAMRISKCARKNVKRMTEHVYVAHSPIHGKGLFAANEIGEDISLGRLQGMPTEEEGTYVLWLSRKVGLELTNEFRFINHSSDPNCALTGLDVVTLRNIAKDDELTHDYGWE